MRLIDVDALLADIEKTIEESGLVNHEVEIMDCIRYAPEINNKTHGEWVEAKSGGMSVYPTGQVMCSICKQRMPAQWKKMPPYCYGCGAKMEESNIDEEGEG
jgi:hypothetical protein